MHLKPDRQSEIDMRKYLLTLLLLFTCACSTTDSKQNDDGKVCAAEGLFIKLSCGDAEAPENFSLTVSYYYYDDLEIGTFQCPDDTIGICRTEGLHLAEIPDAIKIFARAPGFSSQFIEKSAPFSAYNDNGAACDPQQASALDIELEALEPFESNEDYCTGFEADGGLDAYADMAVSLPGELGEALAIKFYMEDINGQPRVYFQNTKRNPLHYEFVSRVLGRPTSLTDYEAQTYHGSERTQMAGTLVYYPDIALNSEASGGQITAPMTVQFFPSDDLTPALALDRKSVV